MYHLGIEGQLLSNFTLFGIQRVEILNQPCNVLVTHFTRKILVLMPPRHWISLVLIQGCLRYGPWTRSSSWSHVVWPPVKSAPSLLFTPDLVPAVLTTCGVALDPDRAGAGSDTPWFPYMRGPAPAPNHPGPTLYMASWHMTQINWRGQQMQFTSWTGRTSHHMWCSPWPAGASTTGARSRNGRVRGDGTGWGQHWEPDGVLIWAEWALWVLDLTYRWGSGGVPWVCSGLWGRSYAIHLAHGLALRLSSTWWVFPTKWSPIKCNKHRKRLDMFHILKVAV